MKNPVADYECAKEILFDFWNAYQKPLSSSDTRDEVIDNATEAIINLMEEARKEEGERILAEFEEKWRTGKSGSYLKWLKEIITSPSL